MVTNLDLKIKKLVFSALAVLFLALFANIGFAQDGVYIDPANYYEMVKVEVLDIDRDGSGTLRVEIPDCDGCTEDFAFNAEAILETPLGPYSGLEKLRDWDDRSVLVVVGKVDGVVRRVTVN